MDDEFLQIKKVLHFFLQIHKNSNRFLMTKIITKLIRKFKAQIFTVKHKAHRHLFISIFSTN